MSETTYLDMEDVDTFISRVPNCYGKKEEIIKWVFYSIFSSRLHFRSLQDCMGRPRQRFMRLMHELDLSDIEYAALIGLALWDQSKIVLLLPFLPLIQQIANIPVKRWLKPFV